MKLAVPSLTLVLSLALAASAGAATFGTDLSRPATSNVPCQTSQFGVPTGAQTCTAWTTQTSATALDETHIVPFGGGTITSARVKAGPVTGPMQFLVLRSIRDVDTTADPACCYPVGASQVFTPRANGVTEVPMNVRAEHKIIEKVFPGRVEHIGVYDHLALSVLSPSVPIPAQFTGLGSALGGIFYPAVAPGQERLAGQGAFAGMRVLINADIEPGDGAAGADGGAAQQGAGTGGAEPTGAAPVTPVRLAGAAARVARGVAGVELRCALTAACTGTVAIGSPRRLGSAAFTVPAGKKAVVKVRLNRAGRALLKRRRSARVTAVVTPRGGSPSASPLTLRR